MKRKTICAALFIMLVVMATAGVSSARDRLMPGEFLIPGQYLTSPNGRYLFYMQKDGNIVLYKVEGNNTKHPLWSSGTSGYHVTKLIMQSDGNLVMYLYRHASWTTHTSGHPGAYLVIQNDGNAVIYTRDHKKALWATYTAR